MATTTMTSVDGILKELYEKRLRDQLQSAIKTIRRIERTSEGVTHEVGGKYVAFPIRVKRNHGIGARNENEALPVPQTQTYKQARVQLKYLYGSMELTGQVLKLASKDPQTFASALDAEVSGLKEGLKKDFNRQVYGTNTGVLATAVTGSTTTLVNTTPGALQYLEVGMIVDVIDSDGSTVNGADVEILTINLATGTVTFAAIGTAVAVNDFMVRADSLGKEITGFSQIVNTAGTVYNVDPASFPVWTGNVDAVAAALSEGRMITMVDAIRTRGGDVTVGFCSLGVRRAYFNLLVQQRRFTNTQTFEGGFKGLAFTTDEGDIPIVSDFDCQPGRLYFVNEKEIKLYEAEDWSFMDYDGSNWQRKITSAGTFDAYQATLVKYCELGTHRRNSHGVLTNVTEA